MQYSKVTVPLSPTGNVGLLPHVPSTRSLALRSSWRFRCTATLVGPVATAKKERFCPPDSQEDKTWAKNGCKMAGMGRRRRDVFSMVRPTRIPKGVSRDGLYRLVERASFFLCLPVFGLVALLDPGVAVLPANWLVPKAPLQNSEGPRCQEARRLLEQGAASLAAQRLLEAARQDPLHDDIVEGLNLVAFACGVSSDQACLQNLLREVAAIVGALPQQSVDLVDLPKLSQLVSSVLNLEAKDSTASEVAELCTISHSSTRLPLVKAVHQVALSCKNPGQRVRLGLGILEQAKRDGLERLGWPEGYALAQLLAGCSLAGAAFLPAARKLVKAMNFVPGSLGTSLQPKLLTFARSLLTDSERLDPEAALVQLAAQCAASPGCVATARHGAVLQGCEGQVLSVGINRNVRLATGRNMDIHAELDALLRLPYLKAARGGRICIVQLDDYGVGFCDAKPCKGGCRQGLQIFQIGKVIHTSKSYGALIEESVPSNPLVQSMSMAHLRSSGLAHALPKIISPGIGEVLFNQEVSPEAVQKLLDEAHLLN
eukprot:s964_g13.t1